MFIWPVNKKNQEVRLFYWFLGADKFVSLFNKKIGDSSVVEWTHYAGYNIVCRFGSEYLCNLH